MSKNLSPIELIQKQLLTGPTSVYEPIQKGGPGSGPHGSSHKVGDAVKLNNTRFHSFYGHTLGPHDSNKMKNKFTITGKSGSVYSLEHANGMRHLANGSHLEKI